MKHTNKGLWIVFTLRNTTFFHGKIPFYFIYYYFILRHLARQSARLQKRLLFPPQPRYVIFRQSRIGNLVSKYHILVFRFLRQWIKTLLPSFLPPKQFATKINSVQYLHIILGILNYHLGDRDNFGGLGLECRQHKVPRMLTLS